MRMIESLRHWGWAALAGASLCVGSLGTGCSDDCDPGPWPEAPDGAGNVIYVSAACDGSGSQDDPYGTIGQAVAAAGDGAAILVDDGT